MRYQAAYSRITGIICGIQRRGAGNQRNSKVFSIELNYSNADYTAETDCYRTVEIRIERKQGNHWHICYVTELTGDSIPRDNQTIQESLAFLRLTDGCQPYFSGYEN